MRVSGFSHQTVLLAETVTLMVPGSSPGLEGRVIVDGTLGGGGHTEALLERGARVFGIDRDPLALQAASARLARFGDRFTAVRGEFGDVSSLIADQVDGFVLDLGVSSPQLDVGARGFSFMHDGPLDMRMSGEGETAAELIERLEVGALADSIYMYGEERASRGIARELKARLPKTTSQAVEAIKAGVPRKAWPKDIHVATRTFQALRIAVNQELDQLERALKAIPSLLKVGGRAAIISFHSLEDRAVKHAFRELCGEAPDDLPKGLPVPAPTRSASFTALTKKPITAGEEESTRNPRARSAKLRGIEKVAA
ncbi:MAG: 16S rRNA (cytosine(1402)-N(4))-methyltransferase RsmH [Archangium sp.]|nr:16S rRNA (cytosine(1402)-N(4))-methyltransferase RsmH [Archangium sp.]